MLGPLSRSRVLCGVLALVAVVAVAGACAPNVPEGFHQYVVFEGLQAPTAMEFSPDGRVFVAEKRGVVQVFDGLDDPRPAVVADLRTNVFNGWDRGLLGLALPPDFPADPSLYVMYAYDAPPGEEAPRWGTPGADVDNCPTPPGYNEDGCVVTGRISRLPLRDGRWTGEEDVLVHDWCHQYPSHSVGSLEFGADGALYASGGEGASFTFPDYGQRGSPRNPCGDPPGGVGGEMTPEFSEGGALRSQDLRTDGDPAGLGGTIIRIDPETGEARPDNPLAGSPDPNARRIVAYGLRNPFRFTLRPGTDELWVGDVGYSTWEELNRTVGDDATVDNFGWPCYEGGGRQPRFDEMDNDVCEWLYLGGPGEVRPPHWTYRHGTEVVEGDRCDESRGSSVTGVAFAPADSVYPDGYDRALFVADSTRQCIWMLPAGPDGRPDPGAVRPFVAPAGSPVELEAGPGGELWYVDIGDGTIRRIGYVGANHVPVAAVTASPTSGDPPLTVTFDGRASTDEDPGDELRFAWDLDGDGLFDDGDTPVVTHTFSEEGRKVGRLRVTDSAGASAVAPAVVTVGDSRAPAPVIEEPEDMLVAPVGATIEFSGSATDADGDPVPASGLSWRADLLHCPDACHRHPDVMSAAGPSGSFVVPDHEFPTTIELHLTARADGESTTVTRRIVYQWTEVTVASEPAGVTLTAGDHSAAAPYTRPFVTNGRVTLTAPATATIDGVPHAFAGWSDGGARSHEIVVPPTATTYTARYTPAG